MDDKLNKLQSLFTKIRKIPDDIGGQVLYLKNLCEYKAEISELKPEIEHLYSEALAEVTEKIRETYKDKEKGNASLIANNIKAEMKDYQRLVSLADRVNSTINYQGDQLRTIISFYKNQG